MVPLKEKKNFKERHGALPWSYLFLVPMFIYLYLANALHVKNLGNHFINTHIYIFFLLLPFTQKTSVVIAWIAEKRILRLARQSLNLETVRISPGETNLESGLSVTPFFFSLLSTLNFQMDFNCNLTYDAVLFRNRNFEWKYITEGWWT